jgi:5'-nucleotidase
MEIARRNPGGVTAVVVLELLLTAAATAAPFHVMVVNDDGVDAPGIAALVAELAADPEYRVSVVAPAEGQSAKGTSLTIRGNLHVTVREPLSGCATWAVAATPSTTVAVGLDALLAHDPPDLVVAGINRGENSGRIAWYSGTVAAARQAVLMGTPGVALSLQLDWQDPQPDFAAAARWAKPVVDAVRRRGLPDGVLLNVNIPRDCSAVKGFRLARMGLAQDAVSGFEVVNEGEGERWYRSHWAPPEGDADGTDTAALLAGFVSVAPLGLDQSAYTELAAVGELDVVAADAAQLSSGARLLLWGFPLALVAVVVAVLLWQLRRRDAE